MAATKKAAAKPPAATKKTQVEVTNIGDAEPSFVDGEDVTEDDPDATSVVEEAPSSSNGSPGGYVWVSRKLPVQIGRQNPVHTEPALIDAKSLPELEAQGYRVVDAPSD